MWLGAPGCVGRGMQSACRAEMGPVGDLRPQNQRLTGLCSCTHPTILLIHTRTHARACAHVSPPSPSPPALSCKTIAPHCMPLLLHLKRVGDIHTHVAYAAHACLSPFPPSPSQAPARPSPSARLSCCTSRLSARVHARPHSARSRRRSRCSKGAAARLARLARGLCCPAAARRPRKGESWSLGCGGARRPRKCGSP